MKHLILGLGILLAGVSFAQKKVNCTHTDVLGKTFTVDYEILGEVVHEEVSSANANLYVYYYAHFDGTTIYLTQYTVNKETQQCDNIYAYSIPKAKVMWSFNDMFNSASTKKTGSNGVISVGLGGGAFGGDLAKLHTIYPFYKRNSTEARKTANGKFKDEATFKKFFAEVMK